MEREPGMVGPLEYRGVGAREGESADGVWAVGLGVGAVVSAWGFWELSSAWPLGGMGLLTFPLVAVVPMLGLSGVVRGVEAVASGRQVVCGVVGMGVSGAAMVGLARMLVG